MTDDFTAEDWQLIGQALDTYYGHVVANMVTVQTGKTDLPCRLVDLKKKTAQQLGQHYPDPEILPESAAHINVPDITSWGSTPPLPIRNPLKVGEHYRIIKQGHKLDGRRVMLERIHAHLPGEETPKPIKHTDDIPVEVHESAQPKPAAPVFLRTWVIDGILNVVEVPPESLVKTGS